MTDPVPLSHSLTLSLSLFAPSLCACVCRALAIVVLNSNFSYIVNFHHIMKRRPKRFSRKSLVHDNSVAYHVEMEEIDAVKKFEKQEEKKQENSPPKTLQDMRDEINKGFFENHWILNPNKDCLVSRLTPNESQLGLSELSFQCLVRPAQGGRPIDAKDFSSEKDLDLSRFEVQVFELDSNERQLSRAVSWKWCRLDNALKDG